MLKKKFDELFSSTRYTKALESIRDIRKKHAQDIRVERATLDALKSNTEKARRLRHTLRELEQRAASQREVAAHVEQQLNQATSELNALLDVYQAAQEISGKISQVTHEKRIIESNMQEIQKTLTVRHESYDELKDMLDNLSKQTRNDEDTRKDYEFEQTRLERQLQSARDAISAKLTELGRLQAAQEVISVPAESFLSVLFC